MTHCMGGGERLKHIFAWSFVARGLHASCMPAPTVLEGRARVVCVMAEVGAGEIQRYPSPSQLSPHKVEEAAAHAAADLVTAGHLAPDDRPPQCLPNPLQPLALRTEVRDGLTEWVDVAHAACARPVVCATRVKLAMWMHVPAACAPSRTCNGAVSDQPAFGVPFPPAVHHRLVLDVELSNVPGCARGTSKCKGAVLGPILLRRPAQQLVRICE